jgi:hypothetical protein
MLFEYEIARIIRQARRDGRRPARNSDISVAYLEQGIQAPKFITAWCGAGVLADEIFLPVLVRSCGLTRQQDACSHIFKDNITPNADFNFGRISQPVLQKRYSLFLPCIPSECLGYERIATKKQFHTTKTDTMLIMARLNLRAAELLVNSEFPNQNAQKGIYMDAASNPGYQIQLREQLFAREGKRDSIKNELDELRKNSGTQGRMIRAKY